MKSSCRQMMVSNPYWLGVLSAGLNVRPLGSTQRATAILNHVHIMYLARQLGIHGENDHSAGIDENTLTGNDNSDKDLESAKRRR